MAIFSTVATLLGADLLALGGDPLLILANVVAVSMTRRDGIVVALLQPFGKDGARPLVVSLTVSITAPHVLSSALL